MKNFLLALLLMSCIEPGAGVSLGEPVSVEIFLRGGPVSVDISLKGEPVSVEVLAGSTQGFADGDGTAALFNNPYGVAVGPDGDIYVADYGNHRIRKITPSGTVSTLAGSTQGFADGQGTDAEFRNPYGIAVDSNGNIYVTDHGNHRIRKITPSGTVSTLAGSTQGFADGENTTAQFNNPYGIAVGPVDSKGNKGNIYVADFSNHRVRKITPSGTVSTLAGSGTVGNVDGRGTDAEFGYPIGIAVNPVDSKGNKGNIYVADFTNHNIRKITPSGTVSTLAGNSRGAVDGQGMAARFDKPVGITVSPNIGPKNGNIYVADRGNKLIRKISPNGMVSTIIQNLNRPEDIGLTSDGLTGYVTTDDHQIIRVRFR